MTTDHVWKMLLLDEHKNYSIDFGSYIACFLFDDS